MTGTDTSTTSTDSMVATTKYEKGTWQATLDRSASLFDKSAGDRKRATALLWDGAQEAITGWLPGSSSDAGAEGLSNEVLDIMGKSRKGDVSKIKTVALAVKNHGLVLSLYPNLSRAYKEATRLTKTVQVEAAEDDAAEKAIEALAVPNSTTTVEGAAAILLSKGIDGAVVAILDALGAKNEAAHRSFMRAVSTEVAARVQAAKPKPTPKVSTPKTGATKAKAGQGQKAKPAPKSGATKAKPKPVSASKGDPNAKALPPKAQPAATKAKPVATRRPARTA